MCVCVCGVDVDVYWGAVFYIASKTERHRDRPRHIIIKLSKIKYKEKILKAAREKQQLTFKGIPIRLTANISAETASQKRVAGHI